MISNLFDENIRDTYWNVELVLKTRQFLYIYITHYIFQENITRRKEIVTRRKKR